MRSEENRGNPKFDLFHYVKMAPNEEYQQTVTKI